MGRFELKEFVEHFHKSALESPWVLWIGSAISRSAPSFQPTAEPIIRALCAHLAHTPETNRLLDAAVADFLPGGCLDLVAPWKNVSMTTGWRMPFEAIMGEISSHTGNLVQSFLKDQFPRSADSEPNLNHAAVAAIAESGLVDIVVTTNFDECLDQIWRGTIIVPTDAFAPPNATPALVKVHGTISDFPTVAVNPDALAKRSRLSWQASLASLLKGRRVLFVGYGFQDRFGLTPALIQADRYGAEFFWADWSFPPNLPLATMSTIKHDLTEPNRNLLLALRPNAASET